jgi:hypothetical protein
VSPNAPAAGDRARCACRLVVEGEKRRRLLVLLAAYADGNGGVCAPSPADLIARVKGIDTERRLRSLLRRLEADGYLRRRPEGDIELLFAAREGDIDPTEQTAVAA